MATYCWLLLLVMMMMTTMVVHAEDSKYFFKILTSNDFSGAKSKIH